MRRDNVISYYDVLEVSKKATPAQIRRAYHRLALRHHPDHNTQTRRLAALRFKLINEAYETLSSADRRSRYDLEHTMESIKASNNNMPLGIFSKVMDLFQGDRS